MTEPTIFLIATEESGDLLGAGLMRSLRARLDGRVRFAGIGGRAMEAEGFSSLFPIHELSIIGFAAVVARLPELLKRIREAADEVLRVDPAMLVIIDSPDFTHRVARRVRARNASIPIVDYVSPTVWAWRPGRAKAMRRYVDHVLALLPFEPEVHARLGGPPCTYVGHPLMQQLAELRPSTEAEQSRRSDEPPVLLVLPGSRRSEIRHHMDVFGETLRRLHDQGVRFDAVLPTLPHVAEQVAEAVRMWPVKPRIVTTEEEKRAAFRIARAAFAKSGTVSLELALAGVPMVVTYRAGAIEIWIGRQLVNLTTIILANLVLGENVIPDHLQEDCTADKLVPALRDVLSDTPQRRRQVEAFAKLDTIMSTGGQPPSERAAEIVIAHLRAR